MPSYLAGFIYAGLPSKSLSSLRSTLQMFDPWDQFRYSSSNIHTTAEPSYYKQLTARVHYGYSPPKQHDFPIQIMNKQTQQSRGTSGQLTAKLPDTCISARLRVLHPENSTSENSINSQLVQVLKHYIQKMPSLQAFQHSSSQFRWHRMHPQNRPSQASSSQFSAITGI